MGAVTGTFLRQGRLIDAAQIDGDLDLDAPSEFTWIEVHDPADGDFSRLQARYQLHGLAVRDSMTPTNVPKVDVYDDQLFVVMKVAWLAGDEIMYGEIDAFLSHATVITIRHGSRGEPVEARSALQRRLGPSRLRPDFVLHAIMDIIVGSYFPVIEMIEDEILAIEQQALDGFLDRARVGRLFRLRRETIHFQHVLARMSEACGKLTNLDYPCIGPDVRPYFRDVQDHLLRLDTMVRRLIGVIGAVFEASNLLEQQRQGVITRQLAAWAAILGVPTAVGGVYGMNFTHMPELDTPYGYPIALGAMLAVCLGLFIRFKSLRWL